MCKAVQAQAAAEAPRPGMPPRWRPVGPGPPFSAPPGSPDTETRGARGWTPHFAHNGRADDDSLMAGSFYCGRDTAQPTDPGPGRVLPPLAIAASKTQAQ